MATRKRAGSTGKDHRFGGDWTSAKLDVLAKYLVRYTTALKGKPKPEDPFRKEYIDAFAGTGYRSMRHDEDESSQSLLFPELAEAPISGVNRLLTRSGDIPASWKARLDKLLGTQDWYEEFYRVEREPTLFSTDEERVIKTRTDVIGRFFNTRLKSVFAGVADSPGVLRNSLGHRLYLLWFAAGNKRGTPIALRIANHLLKELR